MKINEKNKNILRGSNSSVQDFILAAKSVKTGGEPTQFFCCRISCYYKVAKGRVTEWRRNYGDDIEMVWFQV